MLLVVSGWFVKMWSLKYNDASLVSLWCCSSALLPGCHEHYHLALLCHILCHEVVTMEYTDHLLNVPKHDLNYTFPFLIHVRYTTAGKLTKIFVYFVDVKGSEIRIYWQACHQLFWTKFYIIYLFIFFIFLFLFLLLIFCFKSESHYSTSALNSIHSPDRPQTFDSLFALPS